MACGSLGAAVAGACAVSNPGGQRDCRASVHLGKAQRSIRPERIVPPSGADVDVELLMGTRIASAMNRSSGRIEPWRIPAHGRGDSGLGSQRKRVVSVSRLGCVPQGETDAQPDHFWMTWRAQDTVRSTPRELSAHTSSARSNL